jgi:hypothetical protein
MKNPLLLAVLGLLVVITEPTLSFAQGNATEPQETRELREKAEGGDANAQIRLALRYDLGSGVVKNDANSCCFG